MPLVDPDKIKESFEIGRVHSYPLNPADNVLLAAHESLRRRGYCGLNVMLCADLEGELDSSKLKSAVRQLGSRYPALSAHIRYTALLRRAFWHIPADAALEDAIEYEHCTMNGEGADAWEPLQRSLDDSVDPTRGRQVRLVHVEMGEGRHRLGLRWIHPFMDLEGGHLLLRELHAVLCGEPPKLGQDPRAVHDRPFGVRFPKSFLRVWQGRWRYDRCSRFYQPRIVNRPDPQHKKCNVLVRTFGAKLRKRFQAEAKRRCIPGPLLYSRALMVGVARTYSKMATERGRPREQYVFSQALTVPRPGPRPGIHGNYITSPWIVFKNRELADWATADAAAMRQFTEYREKSYDSAMWEMCRATTRWPLALTRLIVTHRIPRLATWCTGYRFGNDTTRLGGARIVNLCAAVSAKCHPGWIVSWTEFDDGMTISVTFYEDYLDRQTAADFLDRLEEEILGSIEAIPNEKNIDGCRSEIGNRNLD